jgi:hypothetical protein
MVVVSIFVCRFGFGQSLTFDPSGDGNLTRGIPYLDAPCITFDANGQPRFHAKRNHPRVVQEPVGMNWYGANCDLVPMLTNHLTHAQHRAHYPQFLRALALAGVSGLDQHHGSETAENYIVSYKCKGSDSSAAWDSILRSIGEQFVSSSRGSSNIRSMVAKFMNEISHSRSLSKDEAVFLLSHGKMIYNTATLKKCSVSSVNLDSLVGGGTNADDSGSNSTTNSTSNSNSFTWPVVLHKYKARDGSLAHVNLFVFCAQHMFTKEVIPQFFGFFDKPTWPLTEEWSR